MSSRLSRQSQVKIFIFILRFEINLDSGPLMTSYDLKIFLFKKLTIRASFLLLIYLFLIKLEIWYLFKNFWPLMTSGDLETPLFEILIFRSSFWLIIHVLSVKIEIWPFSKFWHLMTSGDLWTRIVKTFSRASFLKYNLLT